MKNKSIIKALSAAVLIVSAPLAVMAQETIKIGCNVLSKIDLKDIFKKINLMKSKKIQWQNPYGEGNISQKIVKQIKKLI